MTSTPPPTSARPTSSPARSGPDGTGSRRTCGRRPRATRRSPRPQRVTFSDDLEGNIETLNKRVQTLEYTVDQIGNGSKGLLDEVATGKITGEEDIWSHTDLYDFQANVDGARVGYEGLKPLLDVKDPALSKEIAERFDALQTLLDKYRVGEEGFVFYDKVSEPERKELSDAVNALVGAAVQDDRSHHSVTEPQSSGVSRRGSSESPAREHSRSGPASADSR